MAGLLFFLAVVQLFGGSAVEGVGPRAKDICGLAREIASMGPCLGPDSCPSLDTFRRHFGEPVGPRWLLPEAEKGPRRDGRRRIRPGPRSAFSGPLTCLVEDPS